MSRSFRPNFAHLVNSLEDINKKKKIKVRNSAAMSGEFGSRNENLSKRFVPNACRAYTWYSFFHETFSYFYAKKAYLGLKF